MSLSRCTRSLLSAHGRIQSPRSFLTSPTSSIAALTSQWQHQVCNRAFSSTGSSSLFSSTSSQRMSQLVEGYSPLRLLLIGSPGSGKGTQSNRIHDNFDVNTISSGDLLRKNIALGNDIGVRAAREMKNGAFVSDEVMVQLIDAELNKIGSDQSWLLDGFPRTMTQAKTLDKTLEEVSQPLNLVIHLNVPEDVILQRIMDRWVHIPSGRVYNMSYNPPKQAGLDDVTGECLERRPDDNPETFKIRLQKHHELTEPLLEYYKEKNVLVSITGNTSDEIFPQIRELLQARFKQDDIIAEAEAHI
ncbi:hypothetical protein BG011_006057 [Mortierella polycephala]|uniref:GTP:AMP phosphotransferase, mitochondrial n=1 Tax=Mortierella polycephala TaxID=41804 RepID=A0A9P6QEZ2_9FUNG|nr:hypothetical protein BG011_006057 [Mortierella polycephala]